MSTKAFKKNANPLTKRKGTVLEGVSLEKKIDGIYKWLFSNLRTWKEKSKKGYLGDKLFRK
jgi:hypothetical protein